MIDKISKGISILKAGGLVAYPTDTVYGLGANAENIQAVMRIYRVKNRPLNMPLPLLLADVSWISRITSSIPAIALPLIDKFMPGALTLVLPKSSSISDIVSGGNQTIALRVPAHPVAIALIEGVGSPVVGTSANISGSPSSLTAEEVNNQLGSSIDYIVDGGICPGGVESTILDLTGDVPVMLRQGAITREEIEKVCRIRIKREES